MIILQLFYYQIFGFEQHFECTMHTIGFSTEDEKTLINSKLANIFYGIKKKDLQAILGFISKVSSYKKW